ncbi:MAG: redoxin domain-containing protein, partial [Armatimonadetes bacterium]|nr:redoxin domain-containing protein [Armatimonadota bacterium]
MKAEFEAENTAILGISRDTVQDQQKFAEKFHVTFPLLADPSTETCQAYGVWVE